MADVGDIGDMRRRRAAALALATLLVGAALTLTLLITWRMHVAGPADAGVRTYIEQRRKPPPLPSPAHAPPRSAAFPAIGTPSDIPSDAALAQSLVCFGPDRDKHPECAVHWSDPRLTNSGGPISNAGAFAPPPTTRVLTTASRPAWQGIPDDPCAPGNTGEGAITVCVGFPDPPPPSRSPEELCEAGRIGPCHPPAFRPEDVVHTQHTD
ncbi:MAG: hypothetical protein QM759_06855 [Terricaulis sp.]